MCSAPDTCNVPWSDVPLTAAEKENADVPWYNQAPFAALFSKISHAPADVVKYCSELLLPLLRTSSSLGSELIANKIENHFVSGSVVDPSLLPSVISSLVSHKVTAVDVALLLVTHVLPHAKGTMRKLQVKHVHTLCHDYDR